MTTLRIRPLVASTATVAFLVVALAACASGGSAAGTASPPAASVPGPSDAAPAPTAVPGASDGAAPASPDPSAAVDDPVSGGGGDGDTGTGSGGGPVVVDPGEPEPTIVTPGVGLTGVHPVGAAKLDTATNGRDVAVRVAWWSGVEPCNVLAGVDVAHDGNTFKLTVREGSAAAPDTACIEIAMYKGTIVDLGELEPGTYTITAFGDAPPVTVTVD